MQNNLTETKICSHAMLRVFENHRKSLIQLIGQWGWRIHLQANQFYNEYFLGQNILGIQWLFWTLVEKLLSLEIMSSSFMEKKFGHLLQSFSPWQLKMQWKYLIFVNLGCKTWGSIIGFGFSCSLDIICQNLLGPKKFENLFWVSFS